MSRLMQITSLVSPLLLLTGNMADALTTGLLGAIPGWYEANPLMALGFDTVGMPLTLLIKVIIGSCLAALFIHSRRELHPVAMTLSGVVGLIFWGAAAWCVIGGITIS